MIGLKIDTPEYELALEKSARKFYDFFGFERPGPSPTDYPDEIRNILQAQHIHRIQIAPTKQRAVSKTTPWDLTVYVHSLVDKYQSEFIEEDYIQNEEEGKRGIVCREAVNLLGRDAFDDSEPFILDNGVGEFNNYYSWESQREFTY